MDINLLTIANRASLGNDIVSSITRTKDRIAQIKKIVSKIDSDDSFTAEEVTKEYELGIIGVVSILEQHLNRLLYLVYVSFPSKLGKKQFEISDVATKGSLLEIFYDKATQSILNLAYGRFERFVEAFLDAFEINVQIDKDLLEEINEIKCTRDCLIHADGKANSQYISKAGHKSRVCITGKKLTIDMAYFSGSLDKVMDCINEIERLVPDKYKESSKAYVFKQMWEATCLNERVKFDDAWKIINPNMVHPIDLDNSFGFSSSEIVVYNLFRYAYGRNEEHKVDFALYFERWTPDTNEHQIAVSWLNNQFYF